jgi:hypothetical protein
MGLTIKKKYLFLHFGLLYLKISHLIGDLEGAYFDTSTLHVFSAH